MAPAVAETAGFAQKQARRPVPRIVPAIPLRLSRALPPARPITPEESYKGTVTQHGPEPESQQAVVEKQPDEQSEQHQARAVETPLTPDSRASVADGSETDAPVLANSPASSQHDHVELAADPQGLPSLHTGPASHVPTDVTHHTADGDLDGEPSEAPATPSTSSTETKPVVNGLERKLPIPAQLPPPFYPSNQTEAQTPPAEGPSHRHQLSAGAVVFRSANDSPAIPTIPQETELDVPEQQQSLPRPPPGFAAPLVTPFFTGHSHHLPDAGAPWLHPPYSVAPPDPAYVTGGGYQSPSVPSGPAVFPSLYNGHFSPRDVSFALNGATTSHPQSPSKSQFGEVKLASDQGDEQRAVQYRNGTAPPAERLGESPFELAAYLSNQFGNPEFADFILQVRSPESILVSIPVHGIVVVRSPVVAEAIRRSPASGHHSRDMRRLVDIHALDPFVTRESLEEAFKVLYGAPLLSPQTFLYGLGPYLYENDQASPSSDARRRMQQVLSYIAAARSLQMPSMQAHGVELARMLLRWDTVDQVLQYGLQPSTSPGPPRTKGSDTDDPFTAALLNYAIEFMAYTFPVDFSLYSIAPELQNLPRLPTLVESRMPAHNPRLSKIRFGDAPPEDDLQPSHGTRVLSMVLLSLPLPLIERLFNHPATANQIGWTGAVRIMRDVVNERENRRQKAIRGQLKPLHDGTIPPPLLNNMYVEEQVEPSPLYPSGHRLIAKRLTGEV